jgi:hypothetical protein
MSLKPWLVFLGPLVVLDAFLIFVVVAHRHGRAPAHDEPAPAASAVPAVDVASLSLAPSALPSPKTAPSACFNGETWVYDATRMVWIKLPRTPCRVEGEDRVRR